MRDVARDPPNAAQVSQFVTRVRSHHSWYKHLPIEEGVAFRLRMSPIAGMRYVGRSYIEYIKGDGGNIVLGRTYRTESGCMRSGLKKIELCIALYAWEDFDTTSPSTSVYL
mmetsp:Transcript_70270/g.111046  ORF Transcript_70270/g.111046 Transcript_70270/m.111046 type:complete len:111 (-) Transcript_70270:12-344(-)